MILTGVRTPWEDSHRVPDLTRPWGQKVWCFPQACAEHWAVGPHGSGVGQDWHSKKLWVHVLRATTWTTLLYGLLFWKKKLWDSTLLPSPGWALPVTGNSLPLCWWLTVHILDSFPYVNELWLLILLHHPASSLLPSSISDVWRQPSSHPESRPASLYSTP